MKVSEIPYIQGRNAYSDRDSRKYGIAIHNTSNDASAEAEASYATRRTDGTSAHFYCDADSVVQSLDTAARAGHAGSYEGNDNAIAVEITGVNSWTRRQWLDRVAWDKLGQVLAAVIRAHWPDGSFKVRRASVSEMASNPKIKAFYGHDDMRRAWGGTTHTDPGPGFPWDRLFQAVNAALGGTKQEDDMSWDETLTTKGGVTAPAARFVTDTADRVYVVVNQTLPALSAEVAGLRTDLAEVRAELAALRATPPAAVSREDLEAVLRSVLGSLDGATGAGS